MWCGVLKFARRLYVARSVACGRETPSVTYGDSSLGEGAFGFVQISGIGLPSSPRRVAATADGWCLGFRTIACGREIPSNHRTNCNRCDSCCRLRAGTPSVSFADSSLQLREPRFVLTLRLSKKPSIIYNSQFLIIANQVRSLQYPLASLNWREVAREARRREFSTAVAVYNKLIIPKEFTLFF